MVIVLCSLFYWLIVLVQISVLRRLCMKNKKILLLDNSSLTPLDGDFCCETKTGEFASELKVLGNEVTMYGQLVKEENTVHAYNLNNKEINVVGVKRKKNKIINYLVLYFLAIPEILKADFVYIFYPTAFRYIPFLCRLFKVPYGVYIRGEQGLEFKTSRWIYKNALVIFTVTKYFTELINKLTDKKTAHTIRPMIPLSEKDIVKNRKYPVKDHYTILFLARVEADKGVEELLLAVKELKLQEYAFTLNLVGSGGYLPQAKKLAEHLGISNFVTFHGAILDSDKVRQLYLDADLYVLPTYHEGFPRTLYEAMIFGSPIVTTFVGGIPGLMTDCYNCLEIKPKSVDSIVERMAHALNHPAEMAQYARNAIKTVTPVVNSARLSHAGHLHKVLNK